MTRSNDSETNQENIEFGQKNINERIWWGIFKLAYWFI